RQIITSSVSANYDIDSNLFPFSSLNDSAIKVMKDTVNGIEYYHFNLEIFQIERTPYTYVITNNDSMNNLFFDVEYDGQLAAFNVYYEYMGKEETLEMYFNNTFTPDTDSKFCYYSFGDENKIMISFSNLNNSFRPLPNSRITVEVLTTEGEEGNFPYNQEVQLKLSSDNAFAGVPITIVPMTSSSNGVNQPEVVAEKQRIINKSLTRDSIIMDSDLDNYFTEVNNNYNINESSIRFIKRRNDVLDRTYAAFLLLRDNNGNVLPTNTADRVRFSKSYFDGITDYGNETDGYVIPENSIFIYDYKDNKYKFIPKGLDDSNVKNNYLNDRNKLLYINPYLLKIDKNPFIISNYFKVDIDKEFTLSYNFINDLMPFNITFNTVNIKKVTNYPESMESDTFRITLELDINESMDDLLDNIKLRGVLVSSESNEKHGYF